MGITFLVPAYLSFLATAYVGLGQSLLGNLDAALADANQALKNARAIGHAATLSLALDYAWFVHLRRLRSTILANMVRWRHRSETPECQFCAPGRRRSRQKVHPASSFLALSKTMRVFRPPKQ
jgi:hypothetical protein